MTEQYLSLYDYLGKKAAGSDLGKAVAEEAKRFKIKPTTKEISNPKYTGKILMYPKSFLDKFFSTIPADDFPDDLPF